MIIFFTDLDNTMIYSYKHDIGPDKKMVELYQGREISFVTEKTWELCHEVNKLCLLVPTTTRTIEQYNRIDLGIGIPKYALVCNGGILLENGEENDAWYQESLDRIAPAKKQLEKSMEYLEKDSRRTFELRFIRDLFVFTKCDSPKDVVDELVDKLDTNLVDVFHNGVKVYVVPKTLSKGVALRRLKEKLSADITIAAGDSEFDVVMLNEADFGIAPQSLCDANHFSRNVLEIPKDQLFSEGMLLAVKNIIKKY